MPRNTLENPCSSFHHVAAMYIYVGWSPRQKSAPHAEL